MTAANYKKIRVAKISHKNPIDSWILSDFFRPFTGYFKNRPKKQRRKNDSLIQLLMAGATATWRVGNGLEVSGTLVLGGLG